ncbi:MAG: dipeptide/oligopeptide/nickel ABC transporter permease/ATP-binding protein [Gordonia sp. (in: high G+C Gram-positive bacteria)]
MRRIVPFVALGVLVLVALAAIAAPLLSPYSPLDVDPASVLATPNASHLLGADSSGRDALSRFLFGARVTLGGAGITTVIALVLGGALGLTAGYRGGRIDAVLGWLVQFVLVLPATVILIVTVAVFGPGMARVSVALGLLSAPFFQRVVRSAVRQHRGAPFVDSARLLGASGLRIAVRELGPLTLGPVLVQITLVFGFSIVLQSGIDFLGLGVPQQPSWGAGLREGYVQIYRNPVLLWPPLIGMVAVTLSIGVLALAASDRLAGRTQAFGTSSAPDHETLDSTTTQSEPVPVPTTATITHTGGDHTGTDAHADESLLAYAEDLSVHYPAHRVTALDNVGFTVRRGEILGVVGESGSGKTQIALALLGLLPSTAHSRARRLDVLGRAPLRESQRALRSLRGSGVGYISQDPQSNLDPTTTVAGHLTEPLRTHRGISRAQAYAQALEWLRRVSITDPERVMDSYPHQLSGGMAQRVLIAGALSLTPQLLIADEPTTALDVTTQAEILQLLADLRRRYDIGIVLISHDLGVIAELADRVLVLSAGRVVDDADVHEFFARPTAAYSRSLLAATTIPSVHRARLPGLGQT